ncbi:MAG: tetratricopeptide repeat protein [Opitutaceae bacterium]
MTLLIVGCSKPEEVISTRVSLANQKLEAGEIEDAVEILEELDARYPNKPAVLEALAFAYARAGKNTAAATSFVRAADLDPRSSVLRQLAAEAFQQEGELAKAAEQHRLYLAEFPGDFQSWQKLGDIERESGNLTSAIDACLEWYRLRPTGECAYRLGAAFRALNNSPQAKTWFEATIKHGEAFVEESLLGLLELELEAGDLAAAARTVGQLDRNFPEALNDSRLAGVRQRIAAWREADEALAKARAEQERLARELAEARQSRLREIEESVRAESPPSPAPGAETTAAPAPETDQTSAPPETPEAEPRERPISPVVEVVPTETPPAPEPPAASGIPADTPPMLVAAIKRRESGDIQGAVDMLWRALGDDPSQVRIWAEAADCYRELKQFAQAEACILEARRLAPDSIEVETTYLNIVRASQPPEVYLSRVATAREKFPGNANLAWVFARELAQVEADAARTVTAYEDFLLLADPRDPRRAEAADFLARARR